jgi:hypothetical protein
MSQHTQFGSFSASRRETGPPHLDAQGADYVGFTLSLPNCDSPAVELSLPVRNLRASVCDAKQPPLHRHQT